MMSMISEVIGIKGIIAMVLCALLLGGIYGSYTIGEDVYASEEKVVTINGEKFVIDNEISLTEEEKSFLNGLEEKVDNLLKEFFVFWLVEIPNGQIYESDFFDKIKSESEFF